MSQTGTPTASRAALFARFSISEDWLATIAGLIIVAILGFLITGPAPQTVTLTAPAGETVTASALPQSDFAVSAKLDGQSVSIQDAALVLGASVYLYHCQEGELALEAGTALPEGVEPAAEGRAQLVLINDCAGEVVLTYKTSNVIPWPVFRLFGR